MTGSLRPAHASRRGGRHDEDRRGEVLDIALRHLAEQGSYAAATTSEIAREARISKQSLQQKFGGKAGLFGEAIAREAARLAADVRAAIETSDLEPAEDVLRKFGSALLTRLLSDQSVAINRAAITEATTSPRLAELLHQHGREATASVVQQYLGQAAARGQLRVDDPIEAYETLLGLLLSDWQLGRLLGMRPAPARSAITARVNRAVGQFLILFGPSGERSRARRHVRG